MTVRFSRRLRILSIVVFVAGVVSATLAFSLHPAKGHRLRPARGFTIVLKETISLNDPKWQAEPKQADYVITTRYQKSDGTWKEVRTAHKSDGRVLRKHIQFGIPGRGVYEIDRERLTLKFISSMPSKETTSYVPITDGRDHPLYLKDDVVQGYRTYVLHYIVDKDGTYEDEYYAPELNNHHIRGFKWAPYGHSETEMLSVKLGDPDDSVFSSLPQWSVEYDQFEAKIQALADEGKRETAQALQREMQQHMARELEKQ